MFPSRVLNTHKSDTYLLHQVRLHRSNTASSLAADCVVPQRPPRDKLSINISYIGGGGNAKQDRKFCINSDVARAHTYRHTYVRTYIHTYIQARRRTHAHARTHTHRHTHTHRYTQTYTHVHINTRTMSQSCFTKSLKWSQVDVLDVTREKMKCSQHQVLNWTEILQVRVTTWPQIGLTGILRSSGWPFLRSRSFACCFLSIEHTQAPNIHTDIQTYRQT